MKLPGVGAGAVCRIGSSGAGGVVDFTGSLTVPSLVLLARVVVDVVLVFEATRVVVLDVALGTLVAVVGSVVDVWTLAGVTNCTPTDSGARVSS